MILLLALLPAALGLTLLQRSWAGRPGWPPATTWIGWTLIASTLPAAAFAAGVEHGITIALGMISVLAWMLVAIAPDRRGNRAAAPVRSPQTWPSARELMRQAGILMLVAPLCGLIAAFATLALARVSFGSMNAQLAFTIVVFPLFWGALASAAFIVDQRRHFLFALGLTGVVSIGALLL